MTDNHSKHTQTEELPLFQVDEFEPVNFPLKYGPAYSCWLCEFFGVAIVNIFPSMNIFQQLF